MIKAFLILSIFGLIVSKYEYTQTEEWFDGQLIDHTSPTQKQTWSQRYFVVQDYFLPNNGSVLLYICGEYTCPGVNPKRLFVIDMAQRYNSLILVLEHRYYGASMPYGNQSLINQNLIHLNVHQALDDLAYFILWIQRNRMYGVTPDLSWYTVGGSYPGALSAWFRYKYPHLTVGALASSAVVEAILDFPQFDEQIYISTKKSGNNCPLIIQELTSYAESQLESDQALNFKTLFGAQNLNTGEFLFFFADLFVEMVQYGQRTYMCDELAASQNPLQWIISYVNNPVNDISVEEYGSYYLKNTTFDPNNLKNSRQWTYQYCTEVGYLQTAPKNNAMRSQILNLDFYLQFCKDSFGEAFKPNVEITNTYYGGRAIDVERLIMTNGNEDPWKRASITIQGPTQDMYIYPIDCDDCAHCVELYTPNENDSQNLIVARNRILQHFDEWIQLKQFESQC